MRHYAVHFVKIGRTVAEIITVFFVQVAMTTTVVARINKKHLKNVGPIRHNEPPHANSSGVATVLSHAACASMSTTPTTTTTTRDRGDRYGHMEWLLCWWRFGIEAHAAAAVMNGRSVSTLNTHLWLTTASPKLCALASPALGHVPPSIFNFYFSLFTLQLPIVCQRLSAVIYSNILQSTTTVAVV